MVKLIRNRAFAFAIVTALCAASVLVNAATWFDKERRAAVASLKAEVAERADLASHYRDKAAEYISGDKAVKDLSAAISAADSAKTAEKLIKANSGLTAATGAARSRLNGVDMGDYASYRESIPLDMDSVDSRIYTDTYNRPAREFNEKLKEPLALVLRAMGLVKALPLAD